MRRQFWNRARAGLIAGYGQLESLAGILRGNLIRRGSAPTSKLRATNTPALCAEPLEPRLVLAAGLTMAISEIMADAEAKDRGGGAALPAVLRDYYYQTPDWIELSNFSDAQINLEGWSLTDDADNLNKWTFGPYTELAPEDRPDVTLDPQESLVVFASEREIVDADGVTTDGLAPNGELHTNFKLNNSTEYLALVDANGRIVYEFAPVYPQQFENISYGLASDGETLGYMATPTPGKPNGEVFSAVSIEPMISTLDGDPISTSTFTEDFSIVLSSREEGAVIHYTVNGTLPRASSPVADGPIAINRSTNLRVISIVPGQLPSGVRSVEFFKLNATAAAFTSNLPILLIDTVGSIGAGSQAGGHMAFFEPNGTTGIASILDLPTSSSRIGIKIRGSSTAGFAKSPYALELWEDGFDDDRNISLAGMPAESDWVLQGPFRFDRSYTRNSFIYELSRQVGVYASRTQLIEVFVNQRGGTITGGSGGSSDYRGVYALIEKIKQGEDRVDVGGELSPNFPAVAVAVDENGKLLEGEITGGYLFKDDRTDPDDGGFSAGGATLAYITPKEIDISRGDRKYAVAGTYLRSYINAFTTALNGANFTHPSLKLHYSELIDVQSFVDHHILNELMLNVDALRLSTYYKKVKNGKLFAEPIWDFDRAAESDDGRDDNPRSWYSVRFHTWWAGLFRDPDFVQAWIDRWTEWRRDEFSLENIHAINDRLGAQLVPDPTRQGLGPGARDARRWPGGGSAPRTNGGFNSGQLDGTTLGEIEHMNAWLETRVLWIDGKFLTAPAFSNNGGEIAPGFALGMNASRGAIFYTLDGSDPRAPGGGISAAAFEYDATDPQDIARRTLNQNTIVTARVFDATFNSDFSSISRGEAWSGPTSGIFTVEKPTLTITEINYNPRNPTDDEAAAGFNDDSLFEFVEIYNYGEPGSAPVSLAGVELSDGVKFDFSESSVSSIAPGEYLVVVRSAEAFKMRYPDVDANHIAGVFTGGLKNGGEDIALVDRFQHEFANFEYEDWYNITDGGGFTLSRRDDADTFADLNRRGSWRPSSELLGSPGAADPKTQPAPGAIVINEILTHTDASPTGDWIELLNTTSERIEIGGWYLSDESDNLRKYRFADGTSIGPGQFLVINQFGEDGFGQNAVDVSIDPSGGPNANPGAFGLSELGDTVRLTAVDPDRIRENIDAMHRLPNGNLLISTGGAAVLGDNMLSMGNGDLIEYHTQGARQGEATLFFSERNFLVFDPLTGTFSTGGNEDIDAVSIDPNTGHLILSTDGPATLGVNELTFGNGDLIDFDLTTRTASLLLSEALFDGGNENIDAVHVLANGRLIISLAGDAAIQGIEFVDGDLIEIIPGEGADLAKGELGVGGRAQLFVSETVFAPDEGAVKPTEDIDAVYVAEDGKITLSTNSNEAFVAPLDFAFLNGDLVELTPGDGSNLAAVPAILGEDASARLLFEENPTAGITFLGDVAGYREQAKFAAAEREVTFGIHLKSDGTTDFVTQVESTKNEVNSQPLVGPVVINEIMYNPVPTEFEYIELLNITDETVPLFAIDEVNERQNTWRFSDGVDFAFPENVSLAPSEIVLLLPRWPRQFADFDSFVNDYRANHNLTDDSNDPDFVRIFGPYSGRLSDSGENLELSRPGNPEPNGTVPQILVDRVDYNDRLPWPVLADGGRSSLNRKDSAAYGSDAINWAPSTTDGTPGTPNIALDNSPPSIPDNLKALVTGESRIVITWEASTDDETAVSFYRLLRNGEPVADNPFTTTMYVDTIDVSPNVTFTYEVSAVNLDAFESELSEPLPVNVLAAPLVAATEKTQVKATFETVLNPASVTDISNYVITPKAGGDPLTVISAAVDPLGSPRVATIEISESTRLFEGASYSLSIKNVTAATPGSQMPLGVVVDFTVPDLTLPTITGVQLRGSDWSQELLNHLAAEQGGIVGFDLPTGPVQLDTIAWSGVDTIVIHFSEPVIVSQDDLIITGVNLPTYPTSDFQYDDAALTATWSLKIPLVADKLLVNLTDRVHDPGTNVIDGDWNNGVSTFPSGNDQRAGDNGFRLRLNLLPGDVDGSGEVGRSDLIAVLRQIGRDTSDVDFNPRADVTGDGRIDVADVRGILFRLATRLPSGDPSPADLPPVLATDVVFERIGVGGFPEAAFVNVSPASSPTQVVESSTTFDLARRDTGAHSRPIRRPLGFRTTAARRGRSLSTDAVDTLLRESVAEETPFISLRSRAARRRHR